MTADFDSLLEADAILRAEDADTPVDAWSLDELDRFADLDSVRAARSRTDDVGD
jgi:hypothetical protein